MILNAVTEQIFNVETRIFRTCLLSDTKLFCTLVSQKYTLQTYVCIAKAAVSTFLYATR